MGKDPGRSQLAVAGSSCYGGRALPRPAWTLACIALVALASSCGTFRPSGPASGDDASSESSGAALPPPDPSDLAIATFNVRRFFDTACDSGQCGADDYEEVPTQNQFDYKADTIAEAIAGLQADVVILAEVETQACLDALAERFGDSYPTAVLGEAGFAASVDVAILSRFPAVEVRRHADVPLQRPSGGQTWFSREFLEVHLDADGHQVIVFAAHFKAKVDDDPERRLAEATRARQIVDAVAAENPDALIVLGGDLNDTPGSPPLLALLADNGMKRVAEELVPDDWTYSYQGVHQAIDHLLLSTASTGGQHLPGTTLVFRGEGNDGYGGSDHSALRASFRAE